MPAYQGGFLTSTMGTPMILRPEEVYYAHLKRIAEIPDVALAISSTMNAIKEGGVSFIENELPVQSSRESAFYSLLDAILRSILIFNACAVVIDGTMVPRVLVPGTDGAFVYKEAGDGSGSVQWVMRGASDPNPHVSVSWFNPVEKNMQMNSCVSFIVAAAAQWEELSSNYLSSDFAQSHTSYTMVLRNAGIITSESASLRGSPADARLAVSNIVALQVKAQRSGQAPDTTALVEKMSALTDAVRAQAPTTRPVMRYTTSVTGDVVAAPRSVPGTVAAPVAPGFAVEPASPVSRNPHFMELRSTMWLLPLSAAFGIPPTRLFGFRGPWDSGNLTRSSANMQVEAGYRTRINSFRALVERVFSDISNHGKAASVGAELRWKNVPLALRTAAASSDPSNLLAPYSRYLKRSGEFHRKADDTLTNQPAVDKEGEWIKMLRELAQKIQQTAKDKDIVLELDPIVDYLKNTHGRDYEAWIRRFSSQYGLDPDDIPQAVGPEDKKGPSEPTSVLYGVVWQREPGLAQMLLTMIDGGYVNQDAAMRLVLPELGFRDPAQIDRLLNKAPDAKRVKKETASESDKIKSVPESERHFEGPAQEIGEDSAASGI